MDYLIRNHNKKIYANINLPASKSISNRVLIINALSFNPYTVNNLSLSDDTRILKDALFSNRNKFDVGHAGTAMRFLTAFLAKIAGEWEITGSQRMKERPIKILVGALNQLGAKIEYLEKEGFPPLRILGSHLKGKIIELDGSVSSQYISALLMIAPTIENGLILRLRGTITSRSYIELTLKLMKEFGIRHEWKGNVISVPEQNYLPKDFSVESDWSAASYWYQILALAEKGEAFLENLNLKSYQGDSVIAGWFKTFGIHSVQKEKGLLLSKFSAQKPERLKLDFMENPDVAQTMACLCIALNIPFHFTGLHTLKIKETDRITALKNELSKLGAILVEPSAGELEWDGKVDDNLKESFPCIKTYNDHRMAMAFAPLALAGYPLNIENPEVVTKSYPGFWEDLKKAGFEISKSP